MLRKTDRRINDLSGVVNRINDKVLDLREEVFGPEAFHVPSRGLKQRVERLERENRELWSTLDTLLDYLDVTIEDVEAHKEVKKNE